MRTITIPTSRTLIALAFVAVMGGCSDSGRDNTAAPPKPTPANAIDVCSLVTNQEIGSIQGGVVKESRSGAKAHNGFTVSQCFFLFPRTVDSVVVSLTIKGEGADAVDPKQWWDDTFHSKAENTNASPSQNSEFKQDQPEKVDGLGDEAFWTPPRFGGAFFVLKGNAFVRISVGGAGSKEKKLQKAKAVAELVLKRL